MNNLVDFILKNTTSHFTKEKRIEVKELSSKIIKGFKSSNSSLLVGRVQSGKTTTFINVIAKALSEDFKNIIVLTGTKNDLNEQTLTRINKEFDEEKIFADSSGNVFKINTKRIEDINTTNLSKDGRYKNIIITKKGGTTKKILQMFGNSIKTLIIDDESDHASNNTNQTNKNKDERSATNNVLTQVMSNDNVKYLAVTATPQTHVLMGENEFNLPSKIFFIEAGEGYKGIKSFFENSAPIINYIPEYDATQIRTTENWTTNDDVLSLKDAICEFIIKIWALKEGLIVGKGISKDEQKFETFNMIVNVDLKNSKQEKASFFINDYIDELLSNGDELSRKLGEVFATYLIKTLNIDKPNDQIAKDIKEKIGDSWSVKTLNATSVDNEIPRETSNIIIGGHSLSRGLTIPNLVITYFLQDPKTPVATTTLQRARWFGYRDKYFDFTRLYVTGNIASTFKDLLKVENILWTYAKDKKEHDVDGLRKVFSNYKIAKVAASNIGKYSVVMQGFQKFDNNYTDIMNPHHSLAFEWFNNIIMKDLKNKNVYPGMHENIFKIDLLIKSIDDFYSGDVYSTSVLKYIKEQLLSVKDKTKQDKIRVLGFLNNDKSIRGSKNGWGIDKAFRYVPSGSRKKGKLHDDEYSKQKTNKNIPDLQLHPVINNGKKYVFYSIFVNVKESILKILEEK